MARGYDEQIMKDLKNYVIKKYGGGSFGQFQISEEFFQDFFKTTIGLNAFKNMTSFIKDDSDFEFIEKRGGRNLYKYKGSNNEK